ncbi:hypothetical protein IWQ57_000999 [Coemansia nantahalensis]|uniref:Uncharacterized protein n=1 Tax=Coemansia nantahalensis TaxID=2789366 RepID=A0ACC1K5X2_9FUNG|nr:hypothetical protein IWQ57_000999 [Coemansia nantahalensis]
MPGSTFLETLAEKGFIVDKSLTCKALLETPGSAVRICLPRRFGKTFNLWAIAQFFNPVTANECRGGTEKSHFDAARNKRRKLFCESLLEQEHPDFVEKHFASTPVIQINFRGASSKSLGSFYASLASAIYSAATFWVNAYAVPELLKGRARAKYEALADAYSKTGTYLYTENASQWELRDGHASVLFKVLSEFLVAQHGSKYIILVDEYDQPLEAALGKEWQADADDAYLGMLTKMFKDNIHLAKGLLVGVHEFVLSDRESGLNAAKAISLTTGRYRSRLAESADIRSESLGPLAALFAFTMEDVAELVKRTREVSDAAGAYKQEDIMDAITTWYDGYDFGFPTKRYNPWSVVNFLESLAMGDDIKDAAATYWVASGNTYSIAMLAEDHCKEILRLAPLLLGDYQAGADNSSIRVAGRSGKAECVLPPGDFEKIYIGQTTYPISRADLRGTDDLVTLLLHLGYLTMRPGNGICIPNGEMQVMWSDANMKATFKINEMQRNAERARLLGELHNGEVFHLVQLMEDASTRLHSQNEETFPELIYANALRSELLRIFKGDPGVDIVIEAEAGFGKSDIMMLVRSGRTERDRLLVIIEMKRIPDSITVPKRTGTGKPEGADNAKPKRSTPEAESTEPDPESTEPDPESTKAEPGHTDKAKPKTTKRPLTDEVRASKGRQLALEAVNQIVEKRYAECQTEWPHRLDIGMAVGKGKMVKTHTRRWVWDRDAKYASGVPSVRTHRAQGESVEQWTQHMAAADKTVWADSLGWVTKPNPVVPKTGEGIAPENDEGTVPDANEAVAPDTGKQ